jgi:hypothetical protein
MKTNLNRTIESKTNAIDFLFELHQNNEIFHPDDDASDTIWKEMPNEEQIGTINKLMDDCFKVCDPSDLSYQILYDDAVTFKWIDDNKKVFDASGLHDSFHSVLWSTQGTNIYYPII